MGLLGKIFKPFGKLLKGVGKIIKKGFKAVGKFVNKLGIFGQIGLMALSMWAGPALLQSLGPMLKSFKTAALAGKYGKTVSILAKGAQKIARAGRFVKASVKGTFKSMGSVAKSAGNMIKTTFAKAGEKLGFDMSRVGAQTVGENLATLKSDVAQNFWEAGQIKKGGIFSTPEQALRKTTLADAAAAPEITSISKTGDFTTERIGDTLATRPDLVAEASKLPAIDKEIFNLAQPPDATQLGTFGSESIPTDTLIPKPQDFSKPTDFGLDQFIKQADPIDLGAPSKVAYVQTPLAPTPENLPVLTKGTLSNRVTGQAIGSAIQTGVTTAGLEPEDAYLPGGNTIALADTSSIALEALGSVQEGVRDYLGQQPTTYINNHTYANPDPIEGQDYYNTFMNLEAFNQQPNYSLAQGFGR